MNNSICKTIYNKVSSGVFLYGYAVVALLLPNIALCFTERLSFGAGCVNVLLPLALYMWFFSIARCPGKMVWWAFIFIFFAAFQLVLLYLFGTGVIAVDMFLNLVTTNAGEAMELLDNLAPAVVGCLRHLSATAGSGHYPYQEETSDIGCISASRSKMGDGGGRYRPLLSAGMLCGRG